MAKKINNIHDKYVRESFSDPPKKIAESIPATIKDEVMTTYARIVKENQQIGEQIGIQKGEQIGIKIGATKKINEFVLSSHENGIAISLIANITKLGEEDIMKILKENSTL